MKSIRIEKDITINWTILTDGQATSLDGRNLTLYLVDPERDRTEIDFTTEGNVISFTFYGTEQKYLGNYGLVLYENEGQEGQTVVDYPNAFKLVPFSGWETSSGSDSSITASTVTLNTSNLIINGGEGGGTIVTIDTVLSTTSENPVQNKAIATAMNAKQATLVSGTNIKTINGDSILGSGNIVISGGGSSITVDSTLSSTSENPVQNKAIYSALNDKAPSSHTHTMSEITDWSGGGGSVIVDSALSTTSQNAVQNRVITNALNDCLTDTDVDFMTDTEIDSIIDSEDSESDSYIARFAGKHIAIVGDSISTYTGYIPTGWRNYYTNSNLSSVTNTYWYKVCAALGMTYNNCSYSASRVSGNSLATASDITGASAQCAGCSNARIDALDRDGNTPDIILIALGTNDWGNDVDLGTFDDMSTLPTEGTISTFAPAYALMLYKMQVAYPTAQIFCCTALPRLSHDVDSSAAPPCVNNDGASLNSFNNKIKEIANIFGCNVIDLFACGLNFVNIATYAVDNTLHPNVAGHTLMANKIIAELKAKY